MLSTIIDTILEKIKSLRIVAIICALFTSICIFSSDYFLNKLGIKTLVTNYRMYIGIGFIISIIYLLIELFSKICNIAKNKIKQQWNLQSMRRHLYNLTNDEKRILAYYVINKTKTQKLSYTNGTVRGLELLKIIFRSSNISSYGMLFSYNIQPWAWEYLNKHSELLEPELSFLENNNNNNISSHF
ncbi:hypothetical protein CF087_21110 [Clostridium botulinum]|nr:hypothetical protein [Clostridium botulinum]